MNRILIIAFSVSLVLTSCEKWTEGMTNEIDIPPIDPSIAATLIVAEQDEEIIVEVSTNVNLNDSIQYISDAVIQLTDESGNVIHSLSSEHFEENRYHIHLDEEFGISEGEITLSIDAPELESITSTATMPVTPNVELEFSLASDTMQLWDEVILDRYTINLQNDINRQENYMIYIEQKYYDDWKEEWTDWERSWLFETAAVDPRQEFLYAFGSVALVSDETVSTDPQGLNNIQLLAFSDPELEDVERRVIVESVSVGLKKFYQSLDEYEMWSIDDLFAEPNLIYSNVSSGFGCFGMYSSATIEIE